MIINYKQLENAGYVVDPDKESLTIYAKVPLDLPYDEMRELLTRSGLPASDIHAGLEAFGTEVEITQIMRALR